MSRILRPLCAVCALILLSPLLSGCGGAPAGPKAALPTAESVQKAVTNTVETIKPMVQPSAAGALEWELAGPLKTGACYGSIDAVPGRPAVLRIATYNDPARETFPSVMIWAHVGATNPAGLVNQQVKAQAFAMRTPDGAVWQTPPGQWITITVTAAAEKSISGRIEAGSSLVDTSNNSQVPLSGTFTATFP